MRNTKTRPTDYQYIITAGVLILIWMATDLLGVVNKSEWSNLSGAMLIQPHRFITSALIHKDLGHLLANLTGIVFARYILMQLGLRSTYFYAAIVIVLIPLSNAIEWIWQIYVVGNPLAASLGFSGVLYGVNAFLLCVAIKGKSKFLNIQIDLPSNYQIKQTMIGITIIGQIWNLVGHVSIIGHESGFVAGLILFLL